jgi:methionyl-tRNA formyltransferase
VKVIFFGTSEYCLPVLDCLKKNFELVQVVTMPDRPKGRKQELTPTAVKVWSGKNNIPVTTELNPAEADLAIVADFGRIIPPEIFNKPAQGPGVN